MKGWAKNCVLILEIIFFLLSGLFLSCKNNSISKKNKLFTNESYIENLNENHLDSLNVITVFNFSFNQLNTSIKIFPTENYYYFEFILNGRLFKANIGLLIDERDSGRLSFGCEEVTQIEDKYYKPISFENIFSEKDGLIIKKINPSLYSVKFKGKLIFIDIDNIINEPLSFKLPPNEINVGICLDESGLKFNLLFDTLMNHFFYTLNKSSLINENFLKLTANVYYGIRTGFVFYQDSTNNKRLILFGVSLKNVIDNSIFDGPFDQLPDNYLLSTTAKIKFKELVVKNFPESKGKVNEFGIYKHNTSERVAISPYLAYKNIEDILKVSFACFNSSKSNNQLIYNLTQDRVLKDDN